MWPLKWPLSQKLSHVEQFWWPLTPRGSKSHMASILAPWWPKFSLEAVEARGYSSVPNQCQDWEKFQRQKMVSPKTGDLPLTLPLIWQWREVSIKSETKSEANFQFIFCLWFGTYLELITLSAKSVANSETNFQSWDWTFIASEIHASLGTDLPLIALWGSVSHFAQNCHDFSLKCLLFP